MESRIVGERKRIREKKVIARKEGEKRPQCICTINEPTPRGGRASRFSEQWLLSPFISSTQLSLLYRDASLVAKFNYNKLTGLARARNYPVAG